MEVTNSGAFTDLAIDVPIVNGGLTKSGQGILELNGANSYDGDTTVLAGGLSLTSAALADSADVYLSSGGSLNLDFAGTDVIDSLFLNGVSASAGTWGAVGSGAEFTSSLLFGSGLLQVATSVAPSPGDFNADGSVDGNDLSQWQGDFGQNGSSDADGDNDSDGADFLSWQANLGTTANPLATSQAVPEPATAALLLAVIVLGVSYRPRER